MIDVVNFDEKLINAETTDELKKMKIWLFQEQIRIQARAEELQKLSRELQDLKWTLESERNALNYREKTIKKRFNDSEVLIAKKQKIIEDAYQQLAIDKKALECERLNFEYEKTGIKNRKWQEIEILISMILHHMTVQAFSEE